MQLLLLKFLLSSVLCFLFGVYLARRYGGGPESVPLAARQWRILRGFCLYAGILGLGGMFVPLIWWPWFHFLIYPPLAVLAWALLACVLRRLRPSPPIA